jgi:uncharacterized protein
MITDWTFYAVAIPAVLLMGLGKGGFAGVGVIALPIMALAISPLLAIAIILPILMVQDIVSVWAFRKDFSRRTLWLLTPGSALGMIVGYFAAARVSDAGVLILVGVISVVFVIYSLAKRQAADAPPQTLGWTKATFWSGLSGFTSFIANAGAPPYQVAVVPLKLPPKVFAGTGAMYFAFLNYVKFFAFLHLGQISLPTLKTSVVLFPLAIASTFVGVWLVKRIPLAIFYRIIYALTFTIGVKLMWDGARGFGWI